MRFGIISDPHLAASDAELYVWHNTVDLARSGELLNAAIEWLGSQEIDALVLLGDLTEAANSESFVVVRERALGLGVPVLAVPGNCDVDPVERTLSEFAQIAGPELTVAPAFLLLEVEEHVEEHVVIELIGLAGETGSKRLTGVRATTPSPGARIVLTHYPVLDVEAELMRAGFRHSGNLVNRADIEADVRALELPVVVIHGHLHIHDARISGNLLHLSCAALIEPPHHVSVVEVRGNLDGLTVERWSHSVRVDAVERLPVFAAESDRWVWADGIWSAQPPI